MANTVYSNFYLSNEVEDQFNSHLNLQQFCTLDNNLVGTPGMIRKINVYKATNGTQKLATRLGTTRQVRTMRILWAIRSLTMTSIGYLP